MNEELTQYLDGKFRKIDAEFSAVKGDLTSVKEDLREARKERQLLDKRINDTYNAVDGFIKIVDKLDQEFTLMKEEIRKIKTIIKDKLGVDVE